MSLHEFAPLPEPEPEPPLRVTLATPVRVDAFAIEWHCRSEIYDGGDWYGKCTCGFLTTACLTQEDAHARPCEVEDLLIVSRERERRLFARLGR